MKIELETLKSKRSIKELLEFGIINIDKPSGPTSFNISDFVRKTLGLRKTSHFGTLDPKVTGVLPIALNRACKLTGHFIGHDKEYTGVMRVHEKSSVGEIQKAIDKQFLGKVKQIPPVRSRVKRQEREREVYEFKILEQDEKDFLFSCKVEGGTYIRKLVDDLGKELKIRAHMLELRRIKAGIFDEKNSVNLYDFEKFVEEYNKGNEKLLRQIITPAEIISRIYPVLEIKETNLKLIFTGKPVYREDLKKKEDFKTKETICVFCNNQFVGIYKVLNEKKIFAKSEFVMQPFKN